MVDLVNICPENSIETFVLAKMLLDNHETYMEMCNLCHRLVDLIVGIAMSLAIKKIDYWSSSYDHFSEGVSLGEQRLPHAKSKANLGSPLLFPYF